MAIEKGLIAIAHVEEVFSVSLSSVPVDKLVVSIDEGRHDDVT